ncbi:AI-2E family transporter [Angustibacter sp. McL0619]|uniref:AI-2E family transporter n=1 Tax=Angustibacter sp. McL0619 TaxID=3415676 RepID=UPI003CE7A34C
MIRRKNTTPDDEPTAVAGELEATAGTEAAQTTSQAAQTSGAAVGEQAVGEQAVGEQAVGEHAVAAARAPVGGEDSTFGIPGAPLNRHSPFYLGFFGAIGALLGWALLGLVSQLSSVLTLLAISLFLALGLDPVVQAVQARGLKRGASVTVVFLTVIALFVGIIALLVPPVVREAVELANNAPDLVSRLQRNDQLNKLDDQYHFIEQIQNQLHQKDFWTSLFGGVFGAGKAVASGLFSAFTVLVLTLYLTASLPTAKASVYRMIPRTRRQRVTFLSEEISKRVGGYFLGQVGVATLNAVCSYIMMKIVGVPYSAVLAVTVGLFGLIPMVGATIGAIIVVIVAFFNSTQSAIIVAIYYVVYQQVENYVIAPRIMSRTVSVPGAITVVAALAGGTLLGVLGALMAIPVAAGLLLIYREVLLPRQQAH